MNSERIARAGAQQQLIERGGGIELKSQISADAMRGDKGIRSQKAIARGQAEDSLDDGTTGSDDCNCRRVKVNATL